MKKARIAVVALAVLMLFAAVSCKEPHVHEFSKEWTSDAKNHWHVCECGEKAAEAKHALEVKKDGTNHWNECSECGYKTEEVAHVYGDPQVKDGQVIQVCECGDVKEVANAVVVGMESELKAAIEDGSKAIYLANSITLSKTITIKNGKDVCIFLNGFDISSDECCFIMNASGDGLGGTLKIEGNGSVSTTSSYAFFIFGNSNSEREAACKLSIGKDVKVSGTYAVSVFQGSGNSCYDVKIDIYGKVEGAQPIYVRGSITNTERAIELNIHDNAEISCLDGKAIYLAGYAKTTFGKDVKVTSDGNAIAIAAGELVVNGSIITAGSKEGSDEGSGGSISTKYSSAIYVKQHDTNLSLKVAVNSGVLSGYIPFYQDKGQSATAKPDLVEISITGGDFKVLSSDGPSVKSEDKTGFISGGMYTAKPADEYIKEGFEAKKLSENSWTVVSK